jgi:SAM-dependent methyltransferase
VGHPPDRPTERTPLDVADLRSAWDAHAAEWIAWAREPGHDSYWRFHRDLFLELVPPPAGGTLDLGCGEGRLSRDLEERGHTVTGVDLSPAMIAAARAAGPSTAFYEADAASLPFDDASFDCVLAFMSLQDVGDLEGAIAEAGRVLARGGKLVFAVVHPMSSAGQFTGREPDAPFVVAGSYLASSYYADSTTRGGLEMTFVSAHRPIGRYIAALVDSGFVVEELREHGVPEELIVEERSRRWQRVPLFLHVRAAKRSNVRRRRP